MGDTIDYVNMSLALHYSRLDISRGDFERIEVLKEMNRVLKKGGRAILNLVYSVDFRKEEQFLENLGKMGFRIVDEYCGEVNVGEHYSSKIMTLEKIEDSEAIEGLVGGMNKQDLDGFKFEKIKSGKGLKDSRKIITEFVMNGKTYKIDFNKSDAEIFNEEKSIEEEGRKMMENCSIEEISKEEIVKRGFVRFYGGKRFLLFKKLQSGNGAVVIR